MSKHRMAHEVKSAVAWYTQEEWEAVRREASDPDTFHETYDQ
jgi:hypothetical protein